MQSRMGGGGGGGKGGSGMMVESDKFSWKPDACLSVVVT